MSERTYHNSDDAAYWTEQDARLREPAEPQAVLAAAEDKLARYRGHSDPVLAGMVPELEATVARLRPMVAAQTVAAATEHEAEWTRETTMARREAWNAAVRSGRYTRNGKLHVASLVAAMGFRADDLKAAVARHGL